MIENNAPIIKLAAALLQQAIHDGASQIKIQRGDKSTPVHFCIGETWSPAMTMPRNLSDPLLNRFREMALEARKSGFDRIQLMYNGHRHEIDVTEISPNELLLSIAYESSSGT